MIEAGFARDSAHAHVRARTHAFLLVTAVNLISRFLFDSSESRILTQSYVVRKIKLIWNCTVVLP
jgi:hypothetical protein